MKAQARAVAGALVGWLLLAASAPAGPADVPPQDPAHRIAPGDVLMVRVWNDSRLDGPIAVESDGAVSFPLVGRVEAAGLSVPQLTRELTQRLADGYFKDPHVTVIVLSRNLPKVFALGEVRNPGPAAVRGETPLAELLATVGGLTEQASGKAVIMRPTPAPAGGAPSQKVIHADIQALLAGKVDQNILLLPGDMVIFPPARPRTPQKVYVFGEARSPGIVSLSQDGTLLDAVAAVGGATEESDGTVRLVRAPGNVKIGAPETVEVDLQGVMAGRAGRDITLGDGDVLHFPRRRAQYMYVLGEVVRPGMYPWKAGINAFDAIMMAGGFSRNANREAITVSRLVGAAIQQDRAKADTAVQPGDVVRVYAGLL